MQMAFWDHLGELRSRLIKIIIALVFATCATFFAADLILSWLLHPSPIGKQALISLQPAGVFTISLRLSLMSGLILTLPFLLYQIWSFVAPGLSKAEAKTFLASLYAGTLLFLVGSLFAYFFVIPTALHFFWNYSLKFGIEPSWTLDAYISFVLMLLFSFGLCFELPIVLILLVRFQILSPQTVASKRPYVIVGIAIIAGLLTPPDVMSQVLLMIPLWLLFEISLWISKKIA